MHIHIQGNKNILILGSTDKMIAKDEFNKKLHEALIKNTPDVTLQDIEALNLQEDKECFTNSYWISNCKIFFALASLLDISDESVEPFKDEERNVIVYGMGNVTWEIDADARKFNMGYIGFRVLDVFLFGEDRVDVEDYNETKRVLALHNITDTERAYFEEKLQKQEKDLKARWLL